MCRGMTEGFKVEVESHQVSAMVIERLRDVSSYNLMCVNECKNCGIQIV